MTEGLCVGAHAQGAFLPLPVTLLSRLRRRVSSATPVCAISTAEGSGPLPARLWPLEGVGPRQDPPGKGAIAVFLGWGWGIWFAKACLT